MAKRKKEKELPFSDPFKSENSDTIEGLTEKNEPEEFPGIDKIEKDSEYSEHTEKSDTLEEKKDEPVEETESEKKESEAKKE